MTRPVFLTQSPSQFSEPARFFSQRVTDVNAVPTQPILLGSDCESGSAKTNATRDITVIGSYVLLSFFKRPRKRPLHATATRAIRSKPVRPELSKSVA